MGIHHNKDFDYTELRAFDLFKLLNDSDLKTQINGEIKTYRAGEMVWQKGEPAERFYVFLEGWVQTYKSVRDQRVVMTNLRKGTTGGEMSLLMGTTQLTNGIAMEDTRILEIPVDHFWKMMANCQIVRKEILDNMSKRFKDAQMAYWQREKLVSLGTMAAGLAHELNNPASAAKRDAEELSQTLTEFNIVSTEALKGAMFKEVKPDEFPFQPLFDQLHIEDEESISVMEASEREEELGDWLEETGIENAWDIAPTLSQAGLTREFLEEFIKELKPEWLNTFFNWTMRDIEIRQLSSELTMATNRISNLVTSMKSYSYMDKNVDKESTDLHVGIKDTLTILNHKIKNKNLEVVQALDPELPKIKASGSALNQVWTNLIDNAIDALEPGGQITVRTFCPLDCPDDRVVVEVTDNGPGIPVNIRERIFEPFFTTKGPGSGTGIGLEICYRIVANEHGGTIFLDSEPGRTCFRVTLPVNEQFRIPELEEEEEIMVG